MSQLIYTQVIGWVILDKEKHPFPAFVDAGGNYCFCRPGTGWQRWLAGMELVPQSYID